MRVDALIALGSNRGDRRAHLAFALRALARLPRTRLKKKSRMHASAPVGGPPQGPFLNAAALLATDLSPFGLLTHLKRIEALRGRRAGKRWGARVLDLDIITYGLCRLRGRWLTLPHPQAWKRKFVLIPAEEIVSGPELKRRLNRR